MPPKASASLSLEDDFFGDTDFFEDQNWDDALQRAASELQPTRQPTAPQHIEGGTLSRVTLSRDQQQQEPQYELSSQSRSASFAAALHNRNGKKAPEAPPPTKVMGLAVVCVLVSGLIYTTMLSSTSPGAGMAVDEDPLFLSSASSSQALLGDTNRTVQNFTGELQEVARGDIVRATATPSAPSALASQVGPSGLYSQAVARGRSDMPLGGGVADADGQADTAVASVDVTTQPRKEVHHPTGAPSLATHLRGPQASSSTDGSSLIPRAGFADAEASVAFIADKRGVRQYADVTAALGLLDSGSASLSEGHAPAVALRPPQPLAKRVPSEEREETHILTAAQDAEALEPEDLSAFARAIVLVASRAEAAGAPAALLDILRLPAAAAAAAAGSRDAGGAAAGAAARRRTAARLEAALARFAAAVELDTTARALRQ